jgi:hypothetical protein
VLGVISIIHGTGQLLVLPRPDGQVHARLFVPDHLFSFLALAFNL